MVIGNLGGGVDVSSLPGKEFGHNLQLRQHSVTAVKKLFPRGTIRGGCAQPSPEQGSSAFNDLLHQWEYCIFLSLTAQKNDFFLPG